MRRALRVLLGMALIIVPLGLMAQAPSSGQAGCDAHYPGQCIPSPPPDLDCPQVLYRDFPVLHPNNESDPHGFDSDRNGTGCEGTAGKPMFVATAPTSVLPTSSSSTVPVTSTTTSPRTSATTPPSIPDAILSGTSGQVSGDLGSFAWPQADGTTVARVVDYVAEGPNPAQTLTATQGEMLTLRFTPDLPVATLMAAVWQGGPGDGSLAVPADNPTRFAMTLAPGTHVFTVQVTFQGVRDGRASYAFKLRVVAAEGRPLALTG